MGTRPITAPQDMSFEKITSKDIGKVIKTRAVIEHVTKPKPTIITAIFECRSCMRLYEVDEKEFSPDIYEPSVCQECGGRTFKLLPNDCKFQDTQELTITKQNTFKTMKILVHDEYTSYDLYLPQKEIELEGKVMVEKVKNGFEVYIDCFSINMLEED